MEDYIKAFIEFITKIFAALGTFLGWTTDAEDLTTDVTTAEATEETV